MQITYQQSLSEESGRESRVTRSDAGENAWGVQRRSWYGEGYSGGWPTDFKLLERSCTRSDTLTCAARVRDAMITPVVDSTGGVLVWRDSD